MVTKRITLSKPVSKNQIWGTETMMSPLGSWAVMRLLRRLDDTEVNSANGKSV